MAIFLVCAVAAKDSGEKQLEQNFMVEDIRVANDLNDGTLKKIEEIAEKKIPELKLSADDLMQFYTLVGRELYSRKQYIWARKYYQKAVGVKCKEASKAEAYTQLLALSLRTPAKLEPIARDLKELQRYNTEFPKLASPRSQLVEDVANFHISMEKGYDAPEYLAAKKKLQGAYWGNYILDEELHFLLRRGDTKRAMHLMRQYIPTGNNLAHDLLHDGLRVIEKGQETKVTDLACSKLLQQSPDAQMINVRFCPLLQQKLKDGKISSASKDQMISYLKKYHTDDEHLFGLLKKLEL
jgi:hypothetical protein